MGEINIEIRKMLDIRKEGYIHDPNLILVDYNREVADLKGYHGRELLELLQNAVDELDSTKDKSIKIELDKNVLSFSNNGNVFTKEGIRSLLYSNHSPKYDKHHYIGNKGTGFRSVLNWSDKIKIYSGELSIEFCPENAASLLAEFKKNDNVQKHIAENPFPDLKVATLAAPKFIENINEKAFDTIIELSIRDDMLDNVHEQIKELNSTTMLFLDKLEHLTIICDGHKTEYHKKISRETEEISNITLETYINGSKTEDNENWTLINRNGKINESFFSISVAYKPDMSVQPTAIYSYFKTEVSFPLPVLVHGTFDLDASRNHLTKSDLNKDVLKEILKLVVYVAKEISSKAIDYDALKLLALRSDFPIELSWAKLEDFYFDAIAESNLFPTVNDKYMTFMQGPKLYENKISYYLNGEKFNDLLQYTNDTDIINIIKNLANRFEIKLKYEYDHITAAINEILPGKNLNERASLCLLFIDEYGPYIRVNRHYPKFILDSSGKAIDIGRRVYIPPESKTDTFPQPPRFTRLSLMNKDLVNSFKTALGESFTSRDLERKLYDLNVREYNLTELIRGSITALNNMKDKRIEKCGDFIQWLWKIYKTSQLSRINLQSESINIPIVTRNNTIRSADTLYFGKEYLKNITDKLLNNMDELFVAPPGIFNVQESEIHTFRDFLAKLGVAESPRKFMASFKPSEEYVKQIIKDFQYPIEAQDNILNNVDEARKADIFSVYVNKIEHLEIILDKARTQHIIEWLESDRDVYELATAGYEKYLSGYGFLTIGGQQNGRRFSGDKLSCFTRFTFLNSRWIEIEGERFSPASCILQGNSGKYFQPYVVTPEFKKFIKNKNKEAIETNEMKMLLAKIGAAETYGDLNLDSLYGLLMLLPEKDKSGVISKAVYKSVLEKRGAIEIDKTSQNYQDFLTKGKVYCDNKKKYMPIREVYYLTGRTISEILTSKFNLIAISGRRESQVNIERYFGVKPLRIKDQITILDHKTHVFNKSFKSDFESFKIYANCYRGIDNRNTKSQSLKNMKIELCEEIHAKYEQEEFYFEDYAFIQAKDRTILLKTPGKIRELSQARSDISFRASIAEIITSTIDIQDEKTFSDLRSIYGESEKGRKELISQDFGDTDILEESRAIIEKTKTNKEMFMETCSKIGGKIILSKIRILSEGIDFENINTPGNFEMLINIMNVLGVDFPEFNDKSNFEIDMSLYHIEIFKELTEAQKSEYRNKLYTSLVKANLEQQGQFVDKYEAFDDYDYSPENSVSFNVKEKFYSIWGDILSGEAEYDAESEWIKNKELFLEKKEEKIVNDLLDNNFNNSLLYFGKIELLSKKYNELLAEKEKQDKNSEELLKEDIVEPLPIEIISTTMAPETDLSSEAQEPGKRGRSGRKSSDRDNEAWGAKAEKLVYYTFLKEYTGVKWESENAKKNNVNPDGRSGLGYDLTYKNEDGETIYVEIKSNKNNSLEFSMTPNELNVAEKIGKNYIIALVINVENNEERAIKILPNLFTYNEDENRYSTEKYKLFADSYNIVCKQV
ncbi:MAG: DUF3883 domain-containing protein [Treponema sp.]|nr:DUF3883 domain-containing protein [Treponema sp.]